MRVKDKKIIVTGAGAGIGRELALELIKRGAMVAALDMNREGLEKTRELADSDKLFTYVVNITDDKGLEEFKLRVLNEIGEVDAIINNAGIIQPFIHVNELAMADINRVMDVNFYGPVKLIKMFLPGLKNRSEAHVVNVSSMGGFFPFPGQTVYGASKAALKIFTEGMYAELLNTNVRVTIVFPGAIATEISKNSGVEIASAGNSKMKMTSPKDAAMQIINGMEKDAFQVYVGSDAKMMNVMYKISPKRAIKFINKMMAGMNK